MIILEKPVFPIRFPLQPFLALSLALGFAALVAGLLALLCLIGYVFGLVLSAWSEAIAQITTIYTSSESAIKLLMIVLACWCAYRVARSLYRSLIHK